MYNCLIELISRNGINSKIINVYVYIIKRKKEIKLFD